MAKAYIDNLTEWREVSDIQGKTDSGWTSTQTVYAKSDSGWFPFLGETNSYKIAAQYDSADIASVFSVVDSSENIYSLYSPNVDGIILITKTDKNGNKIWEKTISNGYSSLYPNYMHFDKHTDTILITISIPDSAWGYAINLMKIDLSGNQSFNVGIPANQPSQANIQKLATAPNGNIYIFNYAGTIYVLNSSGSLLNIKATTNSFYAINDIEIDESENIYILSKYTVHKFNSNFTKLSSHYIDSALDATSVFLKMKLFNNNLYVYGSLYYTDIYGYFNNTIPFLSRFDITTNQIQQLSIFNLGIVFGTSYYGNYYQSSGQVLNVQESSNGDIIFYSSVSSSDKRINKSTSDGVLLWRRLVNGASAIELSGDRVLSTSASGDIFEFDTNAPPAINELGVNLSASGMQSQLQVQDSFPAWSTALTSNQSMPIGSYSGSTISSSISASSSNHITFSKVIL